MDLTAEQINALVELQQTDLDAAKKKKALEALPQKQLIVDLRKKRIGIKDKQIDMQAMREDVEAKISALTDEDAKLAAKQSDAQAAIEAAKGDYRSVASYSKDIEGAAKRRDAIADEMLEQTSNMDRIDELLGQVAQALAALDARESQAIASYKSEGGALASELKDLEAVRADIASRIPAEVLASYDRIAKGKCGVALSFMVNGSCSACRSSIDSARAIQMKREGRLSTCPHCGRMIIVG